MLYRKIEITSGSVPRFLGEESKQGNCREMKFEYFPSMKRNFTQYFHIFLFCSENIKNIFVISETPIRRNQKLLNFFQSSRNQVLP